MLPERGGYDLLQLDICVGHCVLCNVFLIQVFTWAMFDRQFNYYEFHIPDKNETRLGVIVAALVILLSFRFT